MIDAMASTDHTHLAWPRGGGELGERIRSFDWVQTPLGPIETWPSSLRRTVDLVLNSSIATILLWGPAYIQIYNDHWRDLIGGKHPAALGQPTHECFPEIKDTMAPIYERAQQGEAVVLQDRLLSIGQDGAAKQVWWNVHYFPVRDESDEAIAGIFCTVIETTAGVLAKRERAAITAMRESEKRFRAFVTASSDAVYWMNSDWTQMRQLQGHNFLAGPPEPNENWVEHYIHQDDRPKVWAAIEKAIQTKSLFELEHRVHRADGNLGWVLSRAVPILNESGDIAEWLGTAKDITAHREIEKRQAFLLNLSDALRIEKDPEAIGMLACRILGEHMGVDRCWIFQLSHNQDTASLGPEYHRSDLAPILGEYSLAHYPESIRRAETEPLVFRDVQNDPGLSDLDKQSLDAMAIGAYLAAVLRKGEQNYIWALAVACRTPRDWTSEDLILIEEVAERAWVKIERARAETALRESETRFRGLVENFAQAIWETNSEGAVVIDSPSWRSYTGQTLGEWLGYGWVNAIHPNDRTYAEWQWREGVAACRAIDAEFRIYHTSSGDYHWTNVRAVPIVNEAGAIQKWVGINIDINDRKQAEARLRERETDLARVQRIGGVGGVDIDVAGGLRSWRSPEYLRLHGLSDDTAEETHEDWLKRVHPEDRAQAENVFFSALQSEATIYDNEYRIIRPSDGNVRWIYVRADIERGDDGTPLRLVGAHVDITAQKEVADRLRESEALLAGQNDAFQAAVSGASLDRSLSALCHTATAHFHDARCAFYIANANGAELRHVVGMPDHYTECIDGFKIGDDSLACGLAAYTGQPVITSDVALEPRWKPWLWLAKRYDYRAVWSFPLKTATGAGVGTFALYFRNPRDATTSERAFADILAQAAAIIISRHQEVEERQRAEDAMRESEERFRQFSEASPDVLWIRDAETLQWEYLSPGFEAVYGEKRDTILQGDNLYNWADLILSEDRELALDNIKRVRNGEQITFEYRIQRPSDEQIRWLRNTDFPIKKPDGTVSRIGGIGQDISKLKSMEAALRESEERFRHFAIHSAHTLWMLDLETQALTQFGSDSEQTWGSSAKPPANQSEWINAVHPEDRERIQLALDKVRLREVSVEEYRIIRADRATRWLQGTFFPILDDKGRVRQIGGIMHDITKNTGSFVYVVDGNDRSSESLAGLLREAGYDVRAFSSSKAFLETAPALAPGCVVCDITLPTTGGLLIAREIKAQRADLPVIIIGDPQGDVRYGVQAIKAGANDFIPIPYSRDDVLDAVASSANLLLTNEKKNHDDEVAKARVAALSEREHEVLEGLLSGGTNKSIAADLGISPRTVEIHRSRVMQRLDVQTLSEAILMATKAGLTPRLRDEDEDDKY